MARSALPPIGVYIVAGLLQMKSIKPRRRLIFSIATVCKSNCFGEKEQFFAVDAGTK
jgi:hypothetical protein